MKEIPPSVPGFRASGVHCGIKTRGLDLALIAADAPCAAAGVFTRSTVVGAPVDLSRQRLRTGRARALIVNSGVSNVAMGVRGRRDAREMARLAARALGCPAREVLVASTGVIGEPLPMSRLRRGIPKAAEALTARGLPRAARAIMTTDTVPKIASRRIRVDGVPVSLAGIAKGAGMVEPNMATMLAFLVTDAAVSPPYLRRLLRDAVGCSFNRISIDGEGSTSDSVIVLASAAARHRTLTGPTSRGAGRFADALEDLCGELARAVVRDGEGATKLVSVCVQGARTSAEAERSVRRIANSLLVKTALAGGDANWGRILQTIGAGRVVFDPARTRIRLAGVTVFCDGRSSGPAARRKAAQKLRAPEVAISVDLGAGRAHAELWTCDLTKEYVRINADYTS